jgi:hypothetical protein
MAAARADADDRAALGDVYVRMVNNPAVARAVGALGEHLRFAGVLPDDARELVILRDAARQGFGCEWSHRTARQAGISEDVVAALAGDGVPEASGRSGAVVEAVDAVAARRSIPAEVQERVVAAFVPERRVAERGAGLGDKFDPALTSTQVASACRTRGSASRSTVHRADRPQGQSDYESELDLILDGLERMADG